jgi:hypothetical protein
MYARDITEERKTEEALRKSNSLQRRGGWRQALRMRSTIRLKLLPTCFSCQDGPVVTGNTKNLLELADKELQRLSHIAARSLKFYRQRTAPTQTSLEELIESVLFFHETEIRTRGIDLDRRYRPRQKCYAIQGRFSR